MQFGLQIGLFIRYYGQATYRNSEYPTRDKVIPFKLFNFLSRCLHANMSYELVGQIQAITLGGAQVMGGKSAKKIHRIVDKIYQEGLGRK